MKRSIFAEAGRFVRTIGADLVEAVQRERAYTRGEPKSALLFLTYRCTSRCRTCKMWSRPWNLKNELSLDQWKEAADVLCAAGVRAMELFGGDVLLRKDVLIPLVRHLKEHDVIVHIPTNSNLLDGHTARMLVESSVDYLYLSVDGIGGVHDAIRGVDDTFSRVQRAVAELLKWRNGQNTPRLICNTTISKYNVESLELIARFAAKTGFEEIHFEYVGEMTPEDVTSSVVDGLEPTPYYLREDESVLVSPPQASLLKKKLVSIRREHRLSDIGVTTLNIDCLSREHLVEGYLPKSKCYTERSEVTIDPGGNVVACPFFHSFKFGNVLEQPFESIWWGERHALFHRHLENKGLAMCRHCILNVQRNHSFPTRLQRIYSRRLRGMQRKLARLTASNGSQHE